MTIPFPPGYKGPGSEQDKRQQQSAVGAIPFPPSMPEVSAPKEAPGFFKSLSNLHTRLFNMMGIGDEKDVRSTYEAMGSFINDEPKRKAIGEQVVNDISNMFSKASLESTVSGIVDATTGIVKHPVNTVAGLPLGLLSMVTNPLKVLSGVDVTASDVVGLSQEEHAHQVKELIGNMAGVLVSGGVSKLAEAGFMGKAGAELGISGGAAEQAVANAGKGVSNADIFSAVRTKDLVKGAASEPVIGNLGRNIISHVASGGAFGATSASFAGANEEDVIASAVMAAVAFAPLGAATGLLAGVKAGSLGKPELLRLAASDVALTRQVQATLDKSLDEIIANASAVAVSDNVLEAIIRGKIKTDPSAITVLRDIPQRHLEEMNKEGLVISTYDRGNGRMDVIAFPKENELFPGREIVSKPGGINPEPRAKDNNGNIIPREGDPVVKTTKHGDIIRGVVAFRNGEMWVRPTDSGRIGGKGGLIRKDGEIQPLTQGNYFKYDPVEWYVDPEALLEKTGVDYGTVHKADKAVNSERNLVARVFGTTGNIPAVGKFAESVREYMGYQGQEFFVRHVDENGMATLESPHKGAAGGIQVPVGDLQIRDANIIEFGAKDFYDHIYERAAGEFGTKPFAEIIANLSGEYGLTNNKLRALRIEMANRFTSDIQKLSDPVEQQRLFKLADEVNEHIMSEDRVVADNIYAQAQRLARSANSNGMWIEDNLTGFRIRNTETQEVLFEGHTPKEGLDFIAKSGQASGADVDAASLIPNTRQTNTPAQALAEPGTRAGLEEIIGNSRRGTLDKIRSKFGAFDIGVPWLSSMRAFISAADEAHGTNFFKPYTRLQNASLLFENTVKSAYKASEPLMQDLRDTFDKPDRMVLAARYRETLSPREIESSLFRDRPLSQGEKNVGGFIAEKNIDETKVLKYRTQRNQILSQMKAVEHQRFGNIDELLKLAKTPEQQSAIIAAKNAGSAQIGKEFKPAFDKLNADYKLSPDEASLFERFEHLAGNGINETGIYGAVRLGRALKEPGIHGLSRQEFALKYGFSAKEINVINKLDHFYEDYAGKFGIEESRRINGYLNHQRMIGGDITDPRDMVRFTSHLENPNAARFMSDMIRTGEVLDYNHDLVEAMRGYIRGGYKAQILFPEIYGKDIGPRKVQGAKDEMIEQIHTLPPASQDQVFRRLNEYVEGISGRQPIPDAALKEASINALKKMGVDISGLPLETSNKTSALINWMQAGLTGGKIYQGLRDVTDVTAKYFIHFGAARAKRFVGAAFDRSQINDLLQKGIIRGVDKNSFINPVESSVYSHAAGAVSKFEDALFKITMQDKVFLQAQAAAYVESKTFAAPILNDVISKKIPLEKAVEKLSLRRFEDNVTKEIGRLLETQGAEAAAEVYARQSARKVIGLFGHGEQPAGWSTKGGRIAGALGMYPITTRQFMVDVATRGTPKEVAGAMSRWAISQGALFTTGKALGFDMGRWIMTPASLVFTGGPLAQFLSDGATAFTSTFQDDKKQKYAYNNIKRAFPSLSDPRSMFLPGSYAAYDIMKGYMLLDQGDARGIGQAMGVPASTDANPLQSGQIGIPYIMQQAGKDITGKNGF